MRLPIDRCPSRNPTPSRALGKGCLENQTAHLGIQNVRANIGALLQKNDPQDDSCALRRLANQTRIPPKTSPSAAPGAGPHEQAVNAPAGWPEVGIRPQYRGDNHAANEHAQTAREEATEKSPF